MTISKKDIRDCVFCGNCKANCPTFRELHHESMSARGRVALIGHLLDKEIEPTADLNKRIFSCILCGACNQSCPLNIDITHAIYDIRATLKDSNRNTRFMSYAISHLFKHIEAYSLLLKLLNYAKNIGINRVKHLQGILNITSDLPSSPLNKTLSLSKTLNPIGRIAVYPGCTTNYVLAKLGLYLIDILNELNYDVVIPRGIVCCGAPLFSIGSKDRAREFAEKNIKIFDKLSVDKIISICPTCVYTMSDTYKKVIGHGVDNMIDSTEFIIDNWNKIKALIRGVDNLLSYKKVIYHHPCHTKNYLHIKGDAVLNILNELGLKAQLDDTCCGFGGLFKVLERELSNNFLEEKKAKYRHVDSVITVCPNCIIQFKTGNIKSLHLIEIIKNLLVLKGL